ncbi:SLT11 [Candida margitis]|uniref:SLT11 n=1 Tax=Candida margitis TaxID=1775924 RepID=UPI0022271E9D|nr:SLT11 [Candida margitis]KAI5952952.1 SLT11 [Candida margitis]
MPNKEEVKGIASSVAGSIVGNKVADKAHLGGTGHIAAGILGGIGGENGEACKQCTRPFTVYRWRNDAASSQQIKTVICYTCSRAKNACQVCLLDKDYRIPTDLRDTALKMAGLESVSLLKSSTNKEVKAIMADKLEKSLDSNQNSQRAKELLSRLAEKVNNGEVTSASIASEVKQDIPISKLIKNLPFGNSLEAVKYPKLTTFFVFGFPSDLPQYLFSKYCSEFGKVQSLVLNHDSRCGFVIFQDRVSAERFAESVNSNGLNKNKKTAGLLELDNYPMRVCFGKQKPLGRTNEDKKQLKAVVSKVMRQLAEKDSKA